MLKGGVQHPLAPTHVETLVDGYLAGVLVDAALDDEGRLTTAGVHLDDAVGEVAILHGRHTSNDLDALDVRRTEHACGGGTGLARLGIVVQTHTIQLDGSTEGGVATLGRCTAQRQAVVGHQRRIDSRTTGQQGADVADIDNLLVLQGGAVDGIGRRGLVGLTLGNDGDLAESQVIFLHDQAQGEDILRNVHRQGALLVAQALDGERQLALDDILDTERALVVGHCPLTALADGNISIADGTTVLIDDLSCQRKLSKSQRLLQHQQQENSAADMDVRDSQFSVRFFRLQRYGVL